MAVRTVIFRHKIKLDDMKSPFCLELPSAVLEGESPNEVTRLQDRWARLVEAADEKRKSCCRSMKRDKSLRSSFEAAMSVLRKSFSNAFENIEVTFSRQVLPPRAYSNHIDRVKYSLFVERLSAVPDSCRHTGASFVAEIPDMPASQRQPEAEAVAEWVGCSSSSSSSSRVTDGSSNAAGAFYGVVASTTPVTTPSAPIVACSLLEDDYNTASAPPMVEDDVEVMMNPPMVLAVASMVHETASTSSHQQTREETKSALERMQELDSIKAFLSEEEYQTKRNAILASI